MSEAAHGVLGENGYRPNRHQNNYSQSQHVVTSECQSEDAWDNAHLSLTETLPSSRCERAHKLVFVAAPPVVVKMPLRT